MAGAKETLDTIVKDVVEGDKAQAKAILDSLRGQKIKSLSDLGEFEEADLEETLKDAQIKPVKTKVALKSKLKGYIKKDKTEKEIFPMLDEYFAKRKLIVEDKEDGVLPKKARSSKLQEDFTAAVIYRDGQCIACNTKSSLEAAHLFGVKEEKTAELSVQALRNLGCGVTHYLSKQMGSRSVVNTIILMTRYYIGPLIQRIQSNFKSTRRKIR